MGLLSGHSIWSIWQSGKQTRDIWQRKSEYVSTKYCFYSLTEVWGWSVGLSLRLYSLSWTRSENRACVATWNSTLDLMRGEQKNALWRGRGVRTRSRYFLPVRGAMSTSGDNADRLRVKRESRSPSRFNYLILDVDLHIHTLCCSRYSLSFRFIKTSSFKYHLKHWITLLYQLEFYSSGN